MMTVSQLSKRSGIAPHVARYYSCIGLLTPVRHPDNDYRSVCFVTQSESAHQRTKYGDAQTLNPWNLTLPPIVHARRYRTSALHSYYPDHRLHVRKDPSHPEPERGVRATLPGSARNHASLREGESLEICRSDCPATTHGTGARREEIPHVPPSSGTICHLIESVVEVRIEA